MVDCLFEKAEREEAIKDESDLKLKHEHQEIESVPEFTTGIFKN